MNTINCSCGASVSQKNYKRHCLTNKHINKTHILPPTPPPSPRELYCSPIVEYKGNNTISIPFAKQLGRLAIPPLTYLKEAKDNALKHGYNTALLQFSNTSHNKLIYDNKFNIGTVNFNDSIINKYIGAKDNYLMTPTNNIINELTRRILWDKQ